MCARCCTNEHLGLTATDPAEKNLKLCELEPGDEFGPTDWLVVDQARIDAFAAATEDHQWIHVDPERATSGPFGATIAHGYLTLSLLAPAFFQLLPSRAG